MLSYEELFQMLDELVVSMPQELYSRLNGGVNLQPGFKMHPVAQNNDFYVLGEYHAGGWLGRYINIYYGSFSRVHGHMQPEQQREELEKVLKHELLHHLEALAGECELEKKDADKIRDYLQRKMGKNLSH